MRNRQQGITFIGWLILLIPIALVGYIGIRVTPVYLNYMKVSRSLEQIASENKGDDQVSEQQMRNSLNKRFDIDNIGFPPVDSIGFTRNGPKGWIARAKYEDEVPLFANISLLLKFDKSVTLK